MSGECVGRLAVPQTKGVLLPDAYAMLDKQLDKNGNLLTEDNKSYTIGWQKPLQPVTRQKADSYELALQYVRHLGLIP